MASNKTKNKSFFLTLTKLEFSLWVTSLLIISVAFLLVETKDYLSLVASLIGATALIYVAKGHVLGQILTVVFSVFYGIISLSFGYYGEMITYLMMTAPIAVASIVTWLKNPSVNNQNEVKVNPISAKECALMCAIGLVVTVCFYFVLKYFNTSYLIISTISVFTSFVASYLTMRRNHYYAVGYAANDIVLIILWTLATIQNSSYLCMVVCFSIFFINDTYGFFSWRKMKRKQEK